MATSDRRTRMWFGTRNHMMWVPCPDVDIPMESVVWGVKTDYMNGGSHVRTSTTAHKEYEFSWTNVSREDFMPVKNYARKMYGDGPIYFVDPMFADYNLLPEYMASPFMILDDAPNLFATGVKVEPVDTPAGTHDYPTRSIRFTATSDTDSVNRAWIPIPPGYKAWVGVHGFDQSGGARIIINPTNGSGFGATIDATLLPVTTNQRVVDEVEGDGLFLSFDYDDPDDSITICGIIVQVLPAGVTPKTGGFASGEGHSGCTFNGRPEFSAFSAAFKNGTAVAELVETEAWK